VYVLVIAFFLFPKVPVKARLPNFLLSSFPHGKGGDFFYLRTGRDGTTTQLGPYRSESPFFVTRRLGLPASSLKRFPCFPESGGPCLFSSFSEVLYAESPAVVDYGPGPVHL